MHVFHIQGSVHKQLYRDPGIPNRPGDRFRAPHGCQLLRLLDSTSTPYHLSKINLTSNISCTAPVIQVTDILQHTYSVCTAKQRLHIVYCNKRIN